MPKLIISFVTAAIFAMPGVAGAQERWNVPDFAVFGEPASADQAADVMATFEAFRAAWGAQDLEAAMALHAPDVEWINAFARTIRTAESLEAFLGERVFTAVPPAIAQGEAEGMTLLSARYLGDDVAVLHAFTESERGASRTSAEDSRRTHIHLVLENQAERWLIVHAAIFDARR